MKEGLNQRRSTQWINRCNALQNARDKSRTEGGTEVSCVECTLAVAFLGEHRRKGNMKMSFVYEGGKGRCVQVWEQLTVMCEKAKQRKLTISEQERVSTLVEEARDLGLIQ